MQCDLVTCESLQGADRTAGFTLTIHPKLGQRRSFVGYMQLGSEEIDLSIKGEPKKLRVARLRTPIDIRGHLRKPSVGIDAGKTLKQGAVAAAIGTVLTPVAAVIAFIDPGLAKDENCAALLQSAQTPPTKTASREEERGTPARR